MNTIGRESRYRQQNNLLWDDTCIVYKMYTDQTPDTVNLAQIEVIIYK